MTAHIVFVSTLVSRTLRFRHTNLINLQLGHFPVINPFYSILHLSRQRIRDRFDILARELALPEPNFCLSGFK